MFDIVRNLHENLDGMAIADEKKQVSTLIIKFVDKVNYGKDLEKSLNFLVDVRQACALQCARCLVYPGALHIEPSGASVDGC